MGKLVWDQTGERLYETGVSKGVLYPQATGGTYPTGVAWNGLTAVTESPSGAEAAPLYADNIKYLPIYTGMKVDPQQGLCIGTENFYAVNKKASAEDQKATVDFVYWLYSSEKGKDYVINKLGFISPFDTFTEFEKSF